MIKTHNCSIVTLSELSDFVEKNYIDDSHKLLIQVFSGNETEDFLTDLIEFFKERYPKSKLIGSTTDGEISSGKVTTKHCSISFTYFEETTLNVSILRNTENDFLLGFNLANNLITNDSKALIVFAAGLDIDGNAFLKGIKRRDKNLMIAGGMSADNSLFKTPFVFTKDEIFTNAAVAVVLNNQNLHVGNGYSFDWELIGQIMSVTKAEGNRVYTIDGEKAVDIYARYLGKDMADDLPAAGSEFPLVISRNGVNIARAAMVKHDDGSLTLAGDIHTGDNVQFGFGNPQMILNPTNSLINTLISSPVETIFVYSCMGRRRFMPDIIEKEINPLEDIAPTSGFFTYGEFYHHDEEYQLLNQTMTILTISESETKIYSKKSILQKDREGDRSISSTVSALAFFVNSTLEKMETLNDSLEDKVHERTKELEKYQVSLEKQVEEEIKKRVEKDNILMQQSRLAAMGEMIGNIAHQWRQPLNSLSLVIGNVEDAFNLKRLDEHLMNRSTAKAYKLIDKMSTTIDDFRNFFSIDKEKTIFTPEEVIKDALALVEVSFKNQNIYVTQTYESNLYIEGYKNELSQVILNLLNNSKDALLEKNMDNLNIDVSGKYDEEWVCITVKDNAGGIPSEIIEKIFDPYFTTKEQGKGTGVGLYMSKMIIEDNMNGKLMAQNDDGGAVLTIKLKRVEKK